jgi:hypothetical protein
MSKQTMAFMGFPNVTPEDVAAGAALLDVVLRAIGALADWLARKEGPLPDGASLAALGVLLEREDVRADLAAKAASNPILLGELRMIADREGGKAPGVAAVLAELEAARVPEATREPGAAKEPGA